MSQIDAVVCVATLSAALTALVALVQSGAWRLSYGLTAFIVMAALGQALILAWPNVFWTPEVYAAWDASLALMAAIGGLELGRGVLRPAVRTWLAVCRRAALLLVPLAAIGAFGMLSIVGTQRVGYRGQLVVDAAVAGLLAVILSAVSLYELPRHAVVVTALRGLGCYLTVQVIYLGSWEWSEGAARLVGWVACGVFVWAMLTIARDGNRLVRVPRRLKASPVR